MAIETADDVTVTTAWAAIATATPTVFASLKKGNDVLIVIGTTAPAADSTRGHVIRPEALRDTFSSSGVITTESVYARTRQGEAVLAVSKG